MLELENQMLKANKNIKMVFYEYLPGETLKNYIDKNKQKISQKIQQQIFMSLFDILGGLNDAKVVHKDLKGENMIINI